MEAIDEGAQGCQISPRRRKVKIIDVRVQKDGVFSQGLGHSGLLMHILGSRLLIEVGMAKAFTYLCAALGEFKMV